MIDVMLIHNLIDLCSCHVMTKLRKGIPKITISYVMRAIRVKLLEQRMQSLLSGVLFNRECSCNELMVINDAISCNIYLLNYAFKLLFRHFVVTLTHGIPQLFKLNRATVIHINLIELFA